MIMQYSQRPIYIIAAILNPILNIIQLFRNTEIFYIESCPLIK